MQFHAPIKAIRQITHDVRQFDFEKPEGYSFEPGQATEVSIAVDGWRDANHPFTFTGLSDDPFLQFTIKIYNEHNGLTEQIAQLQPGDEFIIHDVWGTIQYEGPGVFIAGGAGVTPFIAILRELSRRGELRDNRLIFSNKSAKDVILFEEFKSMLGDNFLSVLTDEPSDGHVFLDGFIDKEFLREVIPDFNQPFYICGPPAFNEAVLGYLEELGASAEALVFEK